MRTIRPKASRPVRLLAASVLVIVTATSAAACGGGDDKAGSGGNARLTISIGAPIANYGAAWVALAKNLFEKEGVTVKVSNFSGTQTGTSQLATGQIDLLISSPLLALQTSAQGKQASVVANLANFNAHSLALVAKSGVTSIDQLKAMGSRCSIAVQPPGAATRAYVHRFQEVYGTKCKLLQEENIGLIASTVAGGQATAGPVPIEAAVSASDAGKANILLNPLTIDKSDADALVPESYPVAVVWGLKKRLSSKGAAIIKFVKALQAAQTLMLNSTPKQLADWSLHDIAGNPFAGQKESSLELGWKNLPAQTGSGSDALDISKSGWEALLKALDADWQLVGFDSGASSGQYDSIVDMSYLDASR